MLIKELLYENICLLHFSAGRKVLHIWLLLISFDFFQNIIQNFHLWPFLWGRPWHAAAILRVSQKIHRDWFHELLPRLPHSSQLFKKVDVVLCLVFFSSLSPSTQETTVWRAPFDKVKTYCQAGDIFYPPTTTNDISESKKGGSMYVCCTLDMGLFLNHNRTPKSFQKFYYAQIDVFLSKYPIIGKEVRFGPIVQRWRRRKIFVTFTLVSSNIFKMTSKCLFYFASWNKNNILSKTNT